MTLYSALTSVADSLPLLAASLATFAATFTVTGVPCWLGLNSTVQIRPAVVAVKPEAVAPVTTISPATKFFTTSEKVTVAVTVPVIIPLTPLISTVGAVLSTV